MTFRLFCAIIAKTEKFPQPPHIGVWLSWQSGCFGSIRPSVQIRPLRPEKVQRASAGLFQLNPSLRTGEIHLRWMKSLRDEIRLCRVKRTDLISSSAKCSISSEGFARRFHRGAPQGPRNELAEFWGKGQCLDFTYYTIFRLNMGCPAPLKIKFKSSPLSIFAPC